MADNSLWIILVAGGLGTRFGALKQFEKIAGKSILNWSIQTAKSITPNLVVVLPEKTPDINLDETNLKHIEGGATRSGSVRQGLKLIDSNNSEIVVVHDAVRPLASQQLFTQVIQAIKDGADAATPALPITDTINTTDGEVIDRTKLLSLQTPQAFRADILKELHASEPEATDDISLFIEANKKVAYIDGETQNLKITEPIDLEIAELLMEKRK